LGGGTTERQLRLGKEAGWSGGGDPAGPWWRLMSHIDID
jgi:hypothetical protein